MRNQWLKMMVFCLILLSGIGLLAALSADRKSEYQEGVDVGYPVFHDVHIYRGALVCINSSGYAVPCADTSGYLFAGVAQKNVDLTTGDTASGDEWVTVRRRGVFKFAATSIAQTSVGSAMYVADDQTFDETSSNAVLVGRLIKYESATLGWISIDTALYTGAAFAASAVTAADTGGYFAAATDKVDEQIQNLAAGPYFITIPRFTGWTKDGAAHAITTLPLFESAVPLQITRAYCSVLTKPGTGKDLVLLLNGSTICTISGDTTATAEGEALTIKIAANTDYTISADETSSGSGANADIILYAIKDDGE